MRPDAAQDGLRRPRLETGMEAMTKLKQDLGERRVGARALGLSSAMVAALCLGGAAMADSSVASDADKALCAKQGGAVEGSGASAICATPKKDAECAAKHGAAYGFDYRTGGCGVRSAEAGETSGGWQDVK